MAKAAGERLATLEARHDGIVQLLERIEKSMNDNFARDIGEHQKLREAVDELKEELQKLSSMQAIEKVKLGMIFSGIAVAANEAIRRILG